MKRYGYELWMDEAEKQYKTPKEPTICIKCKRYRAYDARIEQLKLLYGSLDEYSDYCSKNEIIDFVTGETKNYLYLCRIKNHDGNCPDYEPK